jgi:hypothetical protein
MPTALVADALRRAVDLRGGDIAGVTIPPLAGHLE